MPRTKVTAIDKDGKEFMFATDESQDRVTDFLARLGFTLKLWEDVSKVQDGDPACNCEYCQHARNTPRKPAGTAAEPAPGRVEYVPPITLLVTSSSEYAQLVLEAIGELREYAELLDTICAHMPLHWGPDQDSEPLWDLIRKLEGGR